MRCDEVRKELAAYSLDALEEDEQVEIEAHLSRCADCASEAAALAEVAAGLGQLVPPAAPPPSLRARVLAQAAADDRSQVSSLESDVSGPESRPHALSSRLPGLNPESRIQKLKSRIPPLSALAAAIAIGSLAWAITLQVQLGQQNERLATLARRAERYERVVAVLTSSDLRVRELAGTDVAPGAGGRIVVDPAGQDGMLMVWNLPPVSADQAYQVWFVSEEGRYSAALIRPNERGGGYFFLDVPPDLTRYRAIGLTVEPASGSPGPTGQRVLGGSL